MSQKKSKGSGINQNWKPSTKRALVEELDYYVNGIQKRNLKILSEAITKIESLNVSIDFSLQLLEALNGKTENQSLRIGISGSPGVGKSTFINALGKYLVDLGKRVAVLAIDPSSQINKGSILGDKTRMHDLSQELNAFIRPTPSNRTLGGVAAVTKESIALCEAAGFEIILVETVGVGQSETHLKNLVDIFCLLLLPGAGDDLQGIKKGIVEITDLFIINKADGDRKKLAKQSQKFYESALHFQKAGETDWVKKVLIASGLEGINLDQVWEAMLEFKTIATKENLFYAKRNQQNERWVDEKKQEILADGFRQMAIHEQLNLDQKQSMYKALLGYKETVSELLKEIEK